MSTPASAPRLTLVQSPKADVAVVFRRGPSNWSAVLRWDTATGEVQEGAWLKGRVLHADLCHEGRYLSTMLMKSGQVFNVISVAPWLYPLHFQTETSTWGSCLQFLGRDDPEQGGEKRFGPSPSKPAVRITPCILHRQPLGTPPFRLLPANLQWSAMSPAGRVLMATEEGKLQLAEVRGGNRLKILSEFDTAAIKPNPQPPPQYVKSWGNWTPPRRTKQKDGKR